MIPIKILIIFCGDLKGALGVHPQSLLSGGQLSQGQLSCVSEFKRRYHRKPDRYPHSEK